MSDALEQLKTLLKTGSEDQVRDFIAEHFAEFPEDIQQTFAIELFREAIDSEVKELRTTVALKEEVVRAIEAIQKAR